MNTKVIEVKRYMFFQKIFTNMDKSSCNLPISDVFIDGGYISYDLMTRDNGISVTIIIDEDTSVGGLKFVKEITISTENNSELFVKKFG